MGKDFSDFSFGYSILLCRFKMVLERRIGQPLRHEGDNGYDGTVAERKEVIAAPYFSEKNIIIQTRKFGSKIAECVTSGRLLDFHL